jgi:hypothetical protein
VAGFPYAEFSRAVAARIADTPARTSAVGVIDI